MHNLRDFLPAGVSAVDDIPFGGAAGMVLRIEPLSLGLRQIDPHHQAHRVLMGADGQKFDQKMAMDWSRLERVVLVCGHYKGVDARIESEIDQTVSIGDFVLSGGELAAMVILDAVTRLLPGAVSDFTSVAEDSHFKGILGSPVYTRPREFEGKNVPEVLLSGDHDKIAEYRFITSIQRTIDRRPDLIGQAEFGKEEKEVLRRYQLGYILREE